MKISFFITDSANGKAKKGQKTSKIVGKGKTPKEKSTTAQKPVNNPDKAKARKRYWAIKNAQAKKANATPVVDVKN